MRYEQFDGRGATRPSPTSSCATMLEARGIALDGDAATTTSTRRTAASAPSSPSPRGMLQAADLSEDLLTGDIVSADGRGNLVEAIADFEDGSTEARLLDILCCEGCIMGAGFSCEDPVFKRRSEVSRETRARQDGFDAGRVGRRDRGVQGPRPVAHLRRLRPALRRHAHAGGAARDPGPHEQVHGRGRAGLRRLRLRHLPPPRRGHLAGPGRGGDVPAIRRRGAAQDGGRAAGVAPLAGEHQGSPGEEREAGEHGSAGGRHRPRGQQPARHPAAARQPAAGGLRGRPRGRRRPQAHRGPGQPLQEDHLGAAQLRPAEPRRAAAHRPARPGGGRHPHRADRGGHRGRGGRPPDRPRRRARRRPDRAGAHQPADQRAARHAGRRPHRRHAGRHRGRRGHHGVRHRLRHPRREPGQALQPVLHHQAGGQGHGPRTRRDPRHRQDAPRPDQRGVQRGPGQRARRSTTFTIVLPRYETELTPPASLQEITGS